MPFEAPPLRLELTARERRLYDRARRALQRALPKLPLGRARADARELLFLAPDLLVLLFRLMRDERVPRGNRALALAGFAYVLSPLDLLPGFLFMPLGALDDLVVLAAVLSRLVNHVHPDLVRHHWSGKGDALHAVHRVAAWSEANINARLRGVFFSRR